MKEETILDRIVRHKRIEVNKRKSHRSYDDLMALTPALTTPRPFKSALDSHSPAVIAEIKRASPSQGLIRENFDPIAIARSYVLHGAACLSILTDEAFFKGSDEYLQSVQGEIDLPVLRKDFIVDPYQVIETRVLGADCILLIAAILKKNELSQLYSIARELDLDVLVEVHDYEELEKVLELSPKPNLIGVNNRNLRTFETSLETTAQLAPRIPSHVTIVAESGIHSSADVSFLKKHNIDAFLVGESFMRAAEPGERLAELFAPIRHIA